MNSIILYFHNTSEEMLQVSVFSTSNQSKIHSDFIQSHQQTKRNLGYAFSQIIIFIIKGEEQVGRWTVSVNDSSFGGVDDQTSPKNELNKCFEDCTLRIQIKNSFRSFRQVGYNKNVAELQNLIYSLAVSNVNQIIHNSLKIVEQQQKLIRQRNSSRKSFRDSKDKDKTWSRSRSRINFRQLSSKKNNINQNLRKKTQINFGNSIFDQLNNSIFQESQNSKRLKLGQQHNKSIYFSGLQAIVLNNQQNQFEDKQNIHNIHKKVQFSLLKTSSNKNKKQLIQNKMTFEKKDNLQNDLQQNTLKCLHSINFPNLFGKTQIQPYRNNCIRYPKNYQ